MRDTVQTQMEGVKLRWFVVVPGLVQPRNVRRKYLKYLEWLQEGRPAQKAQKFETLSTGWAIGSVVFKKETSHHDNVADLIRDGKSEHRGQSRPAAHGVVRWKFQRR